MRIDIFAAEGLTDANPEGVLVRWLVKRGDRVARAQALAEIETDKANFEVLAPEAGVVEALVVSPGDTKIDRTTVLARIVTEGEAIEASDEAPAAAAARTDSHRHEPRCAFCHALRVAGRVDCVRCGAPY